MADPFLAEIRMMSFEFAPRGWAQCSGQFLPINQNQALFSLLGTTFGGNGQTNFALPDHRARVPIHAGGGHVLGERAGEQTHTLTISQLPQHVHPVRASSAAASTPVAENSVLAAANDLYSASDALVALGATTVTNMGGSQAHQNMQPFLTLNFCIAIWGLFPFPN
jgi:microcystin-dependent protein